MPGRKFNTPTYRYGFNGMEKEDEIVNTDGADLDFGARIYDARLGRFFSRDPLAYQMASQSPYNFAINCPIMFVDMEGENPKISITINADNTVTITVTTALDVVLDKKHTQIEAEGIIGTPEDLFVGDGCSNQVLVNGQYYEVTYNFVTEKKFYNTKEDATKARNDRGYGTILEFLPSGNSVTNDNVISLAPPDKKYPGDLSHEIAHDVFGITDSYVAVDDGNGKYVKAFLLDQNGNIVRDLMNDAASPLTDDDKSKIAKQLIQITLAQNTMSAEYCTAPLDINQEDKVKAGTNWYGRVDKVHNAHHPDEPFKMLSTSDGRMEINRGIDGTGTRTGKWKDKDGNSKTKPAEKKKGHMNVRFL